MKNLVIAVAVVSVMAETILKNPASIAERLNHGR